MQTYVDPRRHDIEPPPLGPPARQHLPSSAHHQVDPPAYEHPWRTQVADTSLLTPPPGIGNEVSPASNASSDGAERAHAWCAAHPLWSPRPLSAEQLEAVQAGDVSLCAPNEFHGTLELAGRTHGSHRDPLRDEKRPLKDRMMWRLPGRSAKLANAGDTPLNRTRSPDLRRGVCHVRSSPSCGDCLLLSSLPLYSALATGPYRIGRAYTIYFELQVRKLGNPADSRRRLPREEADAGIALGFLAPPCPSWRLPGWQRGSLGVHGDDGRRYMNDPFGGIDFTTAFREGETVGLGMSFEPPRHGREELEIEVFFTREGKRSGGWNLHEQLDERIEGGTTGLDGECDIFAAVGLFGAVEFDTKFASADWLFKLDSQE